MTNKEAIEVLQSMKSDFPLPKAEPRDDTISRQTAIDGVKTLHEAAWKNWHEPTLSANVVLDMIRELPSAQPEIIRCKDCKHFEYNHPYIIQGIPVLGHEVCNAWGDGCKTDENGYCFLAKRRTDE